MPGRVLHQGCTMTCSACHGRITVAAPMNTKMQVNGHLALVQEDVFVPPAADCLGPKSAPTPQPPCTAVRFAGASVSPKLRVGVLHVLLQVGDGTQVGIGTPAAIVLQRGTVQIQETAAKLRHL